MFEQLPSSREVLLLRDKPPLAKYHMVSKGGARGLDIIPPHPDRRQVPSSRSIISIPYLANGMSAKMVNERNHGKGIHGHERVALGGSLLRPQDVTVHEQFCWFPVNINQYGGERGAEMSDVAQSHLPIQQDKSIRGINKENSLDIIPGEQRSHPMHGSLNTSHLTCTELSRISNLEEATSCGKQP